MHPIAELEENIKRVVRMDLQLHFFWSFVLTLGGIYWKPLLASGILITVIKEMLDVIARKGWSWGDFWWGIAGALAAFLFISTL